MAFDIFSLDDVDEYDEDAEEALASYQDAVLDLFWDSPEGVVLRKDYPDMGFYAAQLIYYGYNYVGVTIPQMTAVFVDEIVTEVFPEKISLFSPDDAQQTLPELIAFWQFLKREFTLPNADEILEYLKEFDPDEFVDMMNDPSRFGIAKSFFMAGQSAGFDMTDEKQMKLFQNLYNEALFADFNETETRKEKSTGKKTDEAKEKQKRKAAKAARKRGRRKKK